MSIAFDASYYLLTYPDVAAAVVRGQFPNAYTHFVLHGAKELRNPNAQFNAAEYAGMNPDVANAVAAGTITNVWDHYVTFGIAENRAPSLALKDFDAASYLAIHTDVAAAVTAGTFKSAIDHYLLNGQAEGRTWGENVALTNGTDKLVANKFVAGLVYNPGGTDRINALQDEDELTGIGNNPTLTATLGNANDNGGTTITPILKGIETVNVAFTGSGGAVGAVDTLDLQDSTGLTKAVNITRITDNLGTVAIRNMSAVPAELSVTNSNSPAGNIHFTFLASATAGSADVTKLTLSNVQANQVVLHENNNLSGVETINLVTTGRGPNVLTNLYAKDLVTLNITGEQNLTIREIDDNNLGKFTTIDGSTATGNLNLTINGDLNADMRATNGTGKAIDFTLKTGSGNDTLNVISLGLIGNAADTINLGSGDDTVNFSQTATTTWTDEKTSVAFAGVETINMVRAGGDGVAATNLTLDLSRITADEGKSQTITLTNTGDLGDGLATFTLNNVSAEQATALRLTHSSDTNNDAGDTLVAVNLKTATGATDTVGLTIVDGLNSEPRFNFELTAGGLTDATRVENVTITDSDTESNTVKLTHGDNVLGHTGTITLKGGRAGDFLNLDWSENALRKDDPTLVDPALGKDGVGIQNTVGSNTGALIASVINAEDYAGDVIVRVSSTPAAISAVGAQTIKMGSGNDTVIFDNLNGDTRAGLTISDTVSGGAGSDTLAIGGGVAINLGASEWTNVTGFETIRLLGNGATYSLALTDQLITRNAADGKIINIVNDNDPANDAASGAATAGVGAVSAVTIDARELAVGLNFTYNGEEGAAATNDRFIFVDRNINATAVIDGGAVDNLAATNSLRNGDVIEVRNSAVISSGDLENIRNVGTIELTNHLAATQNFTLQLNDAVVDAMVDSYHSSKATEVERLAIRVYDNSLIAAATTATRLEAGELTAKSALDVLLGRGVNNVTTGAGDERVVLLGNYTPGIYPVEAEFGQSISALATGIGGPRIVTDVINLGDGNDTLVTYGALDVTGSTLTGVETIEGHSAIVLTAAQLNALTSLNFVGSISHELYIKFEAGGPTTVDFSRITVAAGSTLHYNLDGGLTSSGTATGNVVQNLGLTQGNIGNNSVIHLTAGGSFAGTAGVNDTFEGTIASLNGTTISGTATDHDALRLTDAGTVLLGNAPAGGTVTNIQTLILANGANNISFAGTTGIKSIVGNEGVDTVDVTDLASFATGGVITLNGGNDSLTLRGDTYTATMNGGAGTDVLNVVNNTNIAGSTISGFETLALANNAAVTLTLAQHNAFTTINAGGAETLTFTGDGGSITLNANIEAYNFASVTQSLSITTSSTAPSSVSITGGAGNDTITVTDAARSVTTIDLGAAGGLDRVTIQNTAFDAGASGAVTIQNFTAGNGSGSDQINLGGATFTEVTGSAFTGGLANRVLEINSSFGNNTAPATTIAAAIGNTSVDSSTTPTTFYAIVYGTADGAYLYQVQTSDDGTADVVAGDLAVELIANLTGITLNALVEQNFVYMV